MVLSALALLVLYPCRAQTVAATAKPAAKPAPHVQPIGTGPRQGRLRHHGRVERSAIQSDLIWTATTMA
jgi:hypothetical protein